MSADSKNVAEAVKLNTLVENTEVIWHYDKETKIVIIESASLESTKVKEQRTTQPTVLSFSQQAKNLSQGTSISKGKAFKQEWNIISQEDLDFQHSQADIWRVRRMSL